MTILGTIGWRATRRGGTAVADLPPAPTTVGGSARCCQKRQPCCRSASESRRRYGGPRTVVAGIAQPDDERI